MGLDQHACVTNEAITEDTDFDVRSYSELHYWRKHPNLEGWFRDLYYAKGGRKDEFNCAHVRVTERDLGDLEEAVRTDNLPETSGFFFGVSDGSEKEDDLKFIRKAREAIHAGGTVFYSSWW